MARTQKEKIILSEDESETTTSPESTISNAEGTPEKLARHGSILPPAKEKYNPELLSSTSSGYVASESSASAIHESEASNSPSEKQYNYLEKTSIWKNQQLKKKQCDILEHYHSMSERLLHIILHVPVGMELSRWNWFDRRGEISSKKPLLPEDFPCECHLEEKNNIAENTQEVCKNGEEKSTKLETIAQKSNESQIPQDVFHNKSCRVRRLSRFFSFIAEYFIDEEVDPDIFLYIPLPKWKYGLDSVGYKYNALQESRKMLLLKLKEGTKKKIEDVLDVPDYRSIERRNRHRLITFAVLRKLLDELLKPYKKMKKLTKEKDDDDADDSNQNPSKLSHDLIDLDKDGYLLLREKHPSIMEQFQSQSSETSDEEPVDDDKDKADCMAREVYLEGQEESKGPSTSKNENELEIKGRNETENATVNRKVIEKRDTEQETEESKSKRKEGVSQETEESKSKRKKDVSQETEEPQSKRKKDVSQETEEPQSKRKKDVSQETEEP